MPLESALAENRQSRAKLPNCRLHTQNFPTSPEACRCRARPLLSASESPSMRHFNDCDGGYGSCYRMRGMIVARRYGELPPDSTPRGEGSRGHVLKVLGFFLFQETIAPMHRGATLGGCGWIDEISSRLPDGEPRRCCLTRGSAQARQTRAGQRRLRSKCMGSLPVSHRHWESRACSPAGWSKSSTRIPLQATVFPSRSLDAC